MRIYINKEERNFLITIFLEYIEDFLADEQFDEDFECAGSNELELIHSLLNKLSNKEKKRKVKIRYVYEKLQEI